MTPVSYVLRLKPLEGSENGGELYFDEAKDRVSEILETIDLAFKECKIDRK